MRNYTNFFAFLLCAGLPLALPGATITIETTCTNADGVKVTTNNGCSVPRSPGNTGGGEVKATASAALTVSSTAADWTTFSAHAFAMAAPLMISPAIYPTPEASSQVAFSAQLITAGPVRSGFVQLESDGGVFHEGGGTESASLVFGSILNGYPGTHHTFAVTLGESMELQYTAMTHAYASYLEGEGVSTADFQAQFRFLEADGVTPVALSEVASAPEPSTFALLGLALLSLGWWGKRRASVS